MSLLMDALKRAESSKQEAARQQAGKGITPPASSEGLTLAPLASETPAATNRPLPDLATHIDAVDADLARSAQVRPAVEPAPIFAPSAASSQAIARNAFTAKQTPEHPSRASLWLALGLLLIAGLSIAGYFWFQLNTMGSSSLLTAAPSPPPPVQPAFVPPAPPPQAPLAASAADNGMASDGDSRLALPVAPPARQQPTTRVAQPAAPVRLARTVAVTDPALTRAHRALQEGSLEQASQQYLLALQHDPNNVDALLALAAIAQHQGRGNEAEGWRQRALVADPSHPAAQAAVLGGTAAGTDPLATESRLKTLLAAQPQSAELNFTLGNLFAGQRRWGEAQQAYFNAVAADGDNPDYLFNLAVSLDQMRQPRPAAQHYRLALEAAIRRPAAFDTQQARRRLAELAP
jgi:tetratricopeptide (TPR) repeat protein